MIDAYSTQDTWQDGERVREYLANRAVHNQLVLVLGAGASMGCGLPSWRELIDAAHDLSEVARQPDVSDNQAAEDLCSALPGGPGDFAKLIGRALYSRKDPNSGQYESFDERSIQKNELLSAISALIMLSCKRGHGTVVTYNFDDLLETYLAERGIFAYPHITQPSWFRNEDVSVLHPHGFASRNQRVFKSSDTITFTALDFDQQTGQSTNSWRSKLLSIFQSSTPLFLGLSGDDQNLRSVLADVQFSHVSRINGHPYWGIRICKEGDSNIGAWRNRGIWCETVKEYGDIPRLLMAICKRSAEILTASKLGLP
ncbi:SIR2 family protein [Achromobacter spanius]|uniref:SIR2 family protein n=1 Tax=Achromobacter spanius TaxID=217203 RepID=UPI0036EFB746